MRPEVAYLVIDEHTDRALGVFADRRDAQAFAARLGHRHHSAARIDVQPVDWWPAGTWRRPGMLVVDGHFLEYADTMPAVTVHPSVVDAQLRHIRVSRRCTGAGIDITHASAGALAKYHCTRCCSRIY